MRYEEFESALLKLAFETDLRLTEPAVAYQLGCTLDEAKRYLDRMVDAGALELDSDERGDLYFVLPGRPEEPLPPLSEPRPSAIAAARRRPWGACFALNAVWPGLGTLIWGKTIPALGQLGLSIACVVVIIAFRKDFGDAEHRYKLVLLCATLVGAWVWALRSSLQARAAQEDPSR